MTNKKLGPKVESWLKATDTPPDDVRRSVGIVSDRAAQTHQRSRWWPLPRLRPRGQPPPETPHASALEPSPATFGHSPNITGRTMSMLSPAKAVVAGALVFALGGTLFLAQPVAREESAPGAGVETDPTWVSGTIEFATSCQSPPSVTEGGIRRERGYSCGPQSWTADDERLSGSVTATWNADVFLIPGRTPFSTQTSTYDLTNEAGSWRCRADAHLVESSGLDVTGSESATCVGAGGYDGLTAILDIDWPGDGGSYEGVLFAGDAPPMPDATTAG